MKTTLFLAAGLLLAAAAGAQIKNPGFEMLSPGNVTAFWRPPSTVITLPLDTSCSWIDSGYVLFRTSDAHTGQYALGMGVSSYCGYAAGGAVRAAWYDADSGFLDQRIRFTLRPAAFTFYYKLNPVLGDAAAVSIVMEDSNYHTIADADQVFSQATPAWTAATVPLHYRSADPPAFLSLAFRLRTDSVLHLGTRFLIDDIGHTAATAIGSAPEGMAALKCYPVPAGDRLFVDLPGRAGSFRLRITDATGRLLRHEEIALATGKAVIPVEGLAEGVYFLTVSGAGFTATGRFLK